MVTTYFGENDLNRVSFLRTEEEFIRRTLACEHSVYVPFVKGSALCRKDGAKTSNSLLTITYGTATSAFQKVIDNYCTVLNKPESRISESHISLSFLGLKQDDKISNEHVLTYGRNDITYRGIPYYAIDFDEPPSDLKTLFPGDNTKLEFIDSCLMDNFHASLFSHAKMYIDWLRNTRFCTGCGYYTYPIEAGTKVSCGNKDVTIKCHVRDARVNNFCFPRTDPIAIVAIVDDAYEKICLVRTKRKIDDKHAFYSNVAGFMEPGETVENACVREIWEETGINCEPNDIEILASQPWPYPVNLMIGCVAKVKFNGSNEKVNLNHDPELLDAQWFQVSDLVTAVNTHKGGFFMPFVKNYYLPGNQAVAYNMLEYVAQQYTKQHK
ncbi:similar to Saccharomyces cerevisiae YGL067W NPY1 NADH diphosphatase (pyrophosphatase), hydrolyzes the pyrophosphate linkage in NADH and related nucleotides [Maudiozyma saulgeensis]|uniref:NAD(+) diphosphatase n=1 Tax=Maudiozyma saulgeensis TaxID=1789683 RepID=A0A1X7R094_9SACH|nr:similar to Saccharomyces cerevisiae YGL067W NPY1 NADH diphosphatase (pyrophosphatase), hydrolyzes the pyrophosphate linkage in NADH and related nucleotides [Kazachstania saulgeensis]